MGHPASQGQAVAVRRWPIASRRFLGAAFLLGRVACAAGADPVADDWRVAEADARVALSVHGDLYGRDDVALETVLDVNELLGPQRVLAADSLRLVDATSGEAIPLDMAQDAEVRHASGNPVLRLRWLGGPLAPFAERSWHLYLRTVVEGAAEAWRVLPTTSVPHAPDVLFATGFEAAEPGHADRPRLMSPGGRDVTGEQTERGWADHGGRSGPRALRIARRFTGPPPPNSNRPFWWTWPPPVAVRPGQSLRLSGWIRAPRLDAGASVSMTIEFRDAALKRIPGARVVLRGPQVPHDWLLLSRSATAPAAAASAVFWFSLYGAGEAFCDDVTIASITGGDLPALPLVVGPLEERAELAGESGGQSAGNVLVCGRAIAAPVVDGQLDDACWKEAGRIADLAPHRQVPGASVATTVMACADVEALYVGFECREPTTAGLRANATERDGRVWEDDSVEVFLDTNGDRRTYYHVIVNSRGVLFDQDAGVPGLPGASWDGPVSAAARVLPDCWTAEVRVAFNGLRLGEAGGHTWGANFARTSLREGRSLYVWSPVRKNFGEPQHFGRLVLPFDPSRQVVTGRPLAGASVFWGDGHLGFAVVNRRDQPVAVQAAATAVEGAARRSLGSTTATVAAGAAVELPIPASFGDAGEVRVEYELTEAPDGRLLHRASVTHVVPVPLAIEPATRVSYLGEATLAGTWTVGLSPTSLADASLSLAVLPGGAGKSVATAEVPLQGNAGAYAIPASGLPAGTYALRAQLVRGAAVLATTERRIELVPGPFSPVAAP